MKTVREIWPPTTEIRKVALLALIAIASGTMFFKLGSTQERVHTISGPSRVVDGDTVVVAGTTVRLKGVDAAELGTARGENARRTMIALVTKDLTCYLTNERTWGRRVGWCTTTTGIDINREIIISGAALACPRYVDRYMQFEQADALAAQPREVGYCLTTNGVDINQAIIASGAALACPRYDDQYMRFERADALAAQSRSSYCEKKP